MKKIIKFFMMFVLITSLGYSYNRPKKIILSHEDKNAFPWVMPITNGYEGLDIDFLNILSKKLNVDIEFKPLPWSRGLYEMKEGTIDGLFSASYNKDRENYGKYPTKSGILDDKRYIHTSGYSLYVLKDSQIEFDGKNFIGLKGKIGVQRNFSIIPDLLKFSVSIDDSNTDPESLFMKLFFSRVDAVAIQGERADEVLKKNSDLNSKIKKYETNDYPFNLKKYYVMFSNEFYKKYPEFTELFWDMQIEVLNSKEYSDCLKKYK